LGQQIDNLRNEAIKIENEITKVGDAMSLMMINMQNSKHVDCITSVHYINFPTIRMLAP